LADSKIVKSCNSKHVCYKVRHEKTDGHSLLQPVQTISPTIHYTSNHLEIWWLWWWWL